MLQWDSVGVHPTCSPEKKLEHTCHACEGLGKLLIYIVSSHNPEHLPHVAQLSFRPTSSTTVGMLVPSNKSTIDSIKLTTQMQRSLFVIGRHDTINLVNTNVVGKEPLNGHVNRHPHATYKQLQPAQDSYSTTSAIALMLFFARITDLSRWDANHKANHRLEYPLELPRERRNVAHSAVSIRRSPSA